MILLDGEKSPPQHDEGDGLYFEKVQELKIQLTQLNKELEDFDAARAQYIYFLVT